MMVVSIFTAHGWSTFLAKGRHYSQGQLLKKEKLEGGPRWITVCVWNENKL